MLNKYVLKKYFPFVLIRIRISKPFFRLTIPAALFVFTGLIDCALDILEAVQLLAGRRRLPSATFSTPSAADQSDSDKSTVSTAAGSGTKGGLEGIIILLHMLRTVLAGVGSGEPFDLVCVEADGVFIQIRV